MNQTEELKINEAGYYETQGLNIMLFDDFYPEGHQGGLTIIQHGIRVAANGDLRLEPSPGQWSPVPVVLDRKIDKENDKISVRLQYPDTSKDRKGFNPIIYPDLKFSYTIRTEIISEGIRLVVDLDEPLPVEWKEKVGFNFELFPGHFFCESYLMDSVSGIFPRQANGPMISDKDGIFQIKPLAVGKEFIASPGNELKKIRIKSIKNNLELLDGRGLHNNGWFILRTVIASEQTKGAVEWIITPSVVKEWKYKPVIQVSQVGYHPDQNKFAVIELDKNENNFENVKLIKISADEKITIKVSESINLWGNFLRNKYFRFDFSDVKEEGLYKIKYGNSESHTFEIKNNLFGRHVWQPTLEYFLPVQMCHMRIEDRYKVWHGLCHMDDALIAPTNHNHFDGYLQGESTLTEFNSGEHVPGVNIGGWHDAGDYDLRVESQAETVYKLALAYEFFPDDYDVTTVNQDTRVVELHKPDGKPDMLQQIEHGLLSMIGGYESLGRLYRGIISQTLKQYVHLGDAATMTDNIIYEENKKDLIFNKQVPNDDRWIFTEINPGRELYVAQVLAAAYRVIKDYNSELAEKCIRISEEIFNINSSEKSRNKINAAAELYLSTLKKEYEDIVLENEELIIKNIMNFSETIGRLVNKTDNKDFRIKIEKSVAEAYKKVQQEQSENPYGVPYKPNIWGAGWGIQSFGVNQLFLHLSFPEIFPSDYLFNALNFILGVHPGVNTASFASGVGANSLIVAYGVNRDEWSYIPGGVGSGTALIRPDLPELKTWPYLWQQTEYVMGGGATNFILLAMAADFLLNK